ncbi:6464_t:CDS:2, partial [Dentiscutata erythropus]
REKEIADVLGDNFAEDNICTKDVFAKTIRKENIFIDVFAKNGGFYEEDVDKEIMITSTLFGTSGTLTNTTKGTYEITDFFKPVSDFSKRFSIPSIFSIFPMTSWASEFFSRAVAYSKSPLPN